MEIIYNILFSKLSQKYDFQLQLFTDFALIKHNFR